MQIFGRSVESRDVLIAGAGVIAGIGISYVGYKLLKSDKSPASGSVPLGREDLELPLALEFEYGHFKQTCLEVDPISSAFLRDLPDEWFTFNHKFLQFTQTSLKLQTSTRKRALVIGSGTGRLAFELAKTFSEVKGIDNSFTKIVTCFRFQNRTPVVYYFPLEGVYRTTEKTLIPDDLVRPTRRWRWGGGENIEFINANPSFQFPVQLGEFHSVILPNSLNDLDDPEGLLRRLHIFVVEGGQLVLCSDYNWRRDTNSHQGFGEVAVTTSFDFLKSVLGEYFTLAEERNFMRVLPESLRSCHITNTHVTCWIRKSDPSQEELS